MDVHCTIQTPSDSLVLTSGALHQVINLTAVEGWSTNLLPPAMMSTVAEVRQERSEGWSDKGSARPLVRDLRVPKAECVCMLCLLLYSQALELLGGRVSCCALLESRDHDSSATAASACSLELLSSSGRVSCAAT